MTSPWPTHGPFEHGGSDPSFFILQESPEPSDGQTISAPRTLISFSAHLVLSWPGVDKLLPAAARDAYHDDGRNYATILESRRPILSPIASGVDDQRGFDFATQLSLSVTKELSDLSDAYFSTFNLANPIVDRNFYYQHILSVAINGSFGCDLESCVVMAVVALGCLGRKALREGGFPSSSSPGLTHRDSAASPLGEDPEDVQPGHRFVNEARKRIGFWISDNSMQSCQYYLLTA